VTGLAGKTALITGGSSGIGLATAHLMWAAGATVAITGRDPAKLDLAVAAIGAGAIGIIAELDQPGGAEAMMNSLSQHMERLDIVFANAGGTAPTPLGRTDWSAFDHMLRTNLSTAFFTVQAVLPMLGEGSSIILNGSGMRQLGIPQWSAYSAAKAGITGMAKVMASELVERGIRVNTVVPGATRTPIWDRDNPGADIDVIERQIGLTIPIGRMNLAEEVAQAVMFLAADGSRGMTAAEIVVDGGITGAPNGTPLHRLGGQLMP
jgi:NAD(P)-dependent dehydrogenase (short-subunit alcohol dehydrogenase family)